jgi:hypothetical protein
VWAKTNPSGCIYTLTETPREAADHVPRSYLRPLRVAVELYGKEAELGEPFDDQLDDFAEQVEQVVENWLASSHLTAPELGINPSLSHLVSVEIGFHDEGREPLGAARLVWEITYGKQVAEGDPADLDTFATAGIGWDFPPPDKLVEAEDVVELETGSE